MSLSKAAQMVPFERQDDPAERSLQLQKPSSKANSHAIVIFFCTSNIHKLLEVQSILGEENVLLVKVDVDLCEIQGPSVEAIAAAKCRQALQKLQLKKQLLQSHPDQPLAGRKALLLTEDTCLCFNALKGLPGPYIKWFLESIGVEGLPKMLVGFDDKSAYALCTLSVCEVTIGAAGDSLHDVNYESEKILTFQGRTNVSEDHCLHTSILVCSIGRITPEPRGPRTFGWDSIFEPDGVHQTYAEMDKQTKNTISHRYKALKKLKEFLVARD